MHIKTKQGRVVIQGTVGSFFEKQMAQEALRGIEGVKSIENHLEVNWSYKKKRAMARQQELKTMNLLKDSLSESLSQRRYENNCNASKTMARFTLLSLCVIVLLVMKCWF